MKDGLVELATVLVVGLVLTALLSAYFGDAHLSTVLNHIPLNGN